ncbi:hypothetical protein ACFSKL_20170 [Belliella marina]|uniref:Lipocalin-like domain-containing protein n=1 Tax=Belliella marina TaxID=1644146 RepID=A0ABW4VTP7_9BACT
MNNLFRKFLLLSAMGLVLFACKKKDDPNPSKTPEQLAIESLAGESSIIWTVAGDGTPSGTGSVIRGDDNITNTFQDFEITFSANQNSKTYGTSNGGEIFDSSGNWNFVSGDLTKITLAGTRPAAGPEISHTKTTSNDLVLKFNIVAPGGENRGNPGAALAGSYTFNLKRKQ